MHQANVFKLILVSVSFFFLTSCSSPSSVKNAENVCELFKEEPHWLWDAEKAQHRFRVPMSELLAVIYQESHFKRGATPARRKLFNYIPWFPKTTAEGYAQATDETWRVYVQNRKRLKADRDSFEDAVDFVAWYISYAHQRLKIPKTDTYSMYLAYHEGLLGFEQGSYRHKYWLKHVARKVEKRAKSYHLQLNQCLHQLPKRPWWY